MNARTSTSHPLRIDAVDVPGTGGQIGMTLFPGRRDRLSVDGPWERDVAADLAAVRAWKPAIVLSLVQESEYELLGVPAFASHMQSASAAGKFTWLHLSMPVLTQTLPPELQRRFLGSLLGGAIGDAMGAAFEFVSSAQIERAIGAPIVLDFHEAIPGSLLYPRAAGLPTDDTAMTIALLGGIPACRPNCCADRQCGR